MRVLLLHDNRWKNKGSEKVSLPHGSSSIRPPSTTEELFSLQEEDGEPGNLTSLLFLLRAPSVRAECETSDEAQLLRTSVYI
ncbi:uncharacterized protein isoform X20 [Danio rerio]